MKILILSQTGAAYFKMQNWELSELEHEFTILTTDRAKLSYSNFGNNVHVHSVESWSQTIVLMKIKQIWNEMPFDRIFAIDEFDIEIAAAVRKYYQLPGQSEESSCFFRDKLVMNRHIRDCGLKAPITESVKTLFDVYLFAEKVGYPIIVKPISGAGTTRTVKIDSVDEVRKVIDFEFEKEQFIVQNFISGDLYHIDALVIEDKVKFIKTSQYLFPTIDHFKNRSTASVQLTESEAVIFTKYTQELLEMIPLPHTTLLHLEVFYDGQDIYFLEIASRLGGGGIHATLIEQFGIDPLYMQLLAELKEMEKIPDFVERCPSSYGQIMVAPEIGRVVSLPENVLAYQREMGIFDMFFFARMGTVYEKRETSVQAICRVTLKGDSKNDVVQKLLSVEKYVKEQTLIR